MKKLLLLILILIGFTACYQPEEKQQTIKYPKEYVIEIKYSDNTLDTINYTARNESKVIFYIKTIQYGLIKDVEITPTLIATFQNGICEEFVAYDIRSFQIIQLNY